jgi:methylglutaconyl-CoA hydratase
LIRYSIAAGIARITLDRAEKRNALNLEMIAALKHALEQSAADNAVRIVVLEGAGHDFCAGMDLASLHGTAEAGVLDHLDTARRLAEVFLAIRKHPRPVVAAVRGRALGGGCGIATASDLILAAESAAFGYPEVKVGLVAAMVMAILRRSVSDKRAFELLATGEAIGAKEAAAIGMINRVFPDGEFDRSVQAYAEDLAAKSASALELMKNLLHHTDGLSFEAALESGIYTNAVARMTDDAKRGIGRFTRKAR